MIQLTIIWTVKVVACSFLPSPSFIAGGGVNLTTNTFRKQRKMTYDPAQTYITDYFKVLDEKETLAKENENYPIYSNSVFPINTLILAPMDEP